MPRPPRPVSPRVKPFLLTCALLVSTAASAVEVDPKLEKAIRDSLPVCAGAKLKFEELQAKLPPRFKGVLVKVESANHYCDTQAAGVVSPTGGFYTGMPWNISAEEGTTLADKLKNFVWRNFQMNATATMDPKPTVDGLYTVTMLESTEHGKIPLDGEIHIESGIFFLGRFRRIDEPAANRVKIFDDLLGKSPSRGPADAKVTIIEFSDFECPSCRRAASYVDPILTKYNGKVRYIRYDMPLSGHPWAFPAALAGRAIYRQKPELFWEYKKEVYANQEKLNAFMFWDWARGFAEQHQLDLTKYDADLASEALRGEILKGAGLALTNEVRSTPTYMVNGTVVDAGEGGKTLAEYVETLLK